MVLISGLFVFFSHEFGIDRTEAYQQILRIFIPLFVIAFFLFIPLFVVVFFLYGFSIILEL
jgi:hypothetical protein